MMNELIIDHSCFLYCAVALLSLALGSLLNVIIYRLPIMLHREFKRHCCALLELEEEHRDAINLFFPRSFCPYCHSMVKAWQNIPLLSYVLLRGRCARCKHPIAIRYPFIELLTLVLALFATWHFGFTWQLVFALLAILFLICLFFIDLDHQLLPDCLTLGLLWLGLIANTGNLFAPLPQAVLSAPAAYVALWLFIQIFYWITGKIGMGHGDFKLFAAFGAWFGWVYLPLILLFSCLCGSIIGLIYLRIQGKPKDSAIAFGPFLCVSGLITLFWGQEIVAWYLHHILALT